MGKHKIRDSKVCQNCGAFVENNYCPKCGQENSESRQTFHHVFTHFIFDFLHYDSSFWKTTKYLFLAPGKLSLEYMNGKRKSYVNPFTLYIFISFIAFFVPAILPEAPDGDNDKNIHININLGLSGKEKEEESGLKINAPKEDKRGKEHKQSEDYVGMGIAKLDSAYRAKPKEKQFINPDGWIYKTSWVIIANLTDEKKSDNAVEFFVHNLPKVLFIYMPLFAFWLWLFHNKKKKYYFDSAIFTLHFFSATLLTITIASIVSCLFDWLDLGKGFYFLLYLSMILYITFYFFRGNRIFFEECRIISNIKSFILIGINSLFIPIIFLLYIAFIVYKIYT